MISFLPGHYSQRGDWNQEVAEAKVVPRASLVDSASLLIEETALLLIWATEVARHTETIDHLKLMSWISRSSAIFPWTRDYSHRPLCMLRAYLSQLHVPEITKLDIH